MRITKLLAVFFLVAVSLFAVPQWSKDKPVITPEQFKAHKLAIDAEHAWIAPVIDKKEFPNLGELSRPVYAKFKGAERTENGPMPESLCDEGYYWMGGEAWTCDTDGSAMVWGAGGNLYFADASDPTHPVEMWWGDIPLRVRIHNGIAYFFCLFYTYRFDVHNPGSPVFLGYCQGYQYGFMDAVPTADDSYLLMPNWNWGDLWVFDISAGKFVHEVASPSGLSNYTGIAVPEDDHSQGKVAILSDWSNSMVDFFDISDLVCSPPTLIESLPLNNMGMVLYKYPYLYGSWLPWQYYNPNIMGGTYNDYCWISIYRITDLHHPSNNLYIGNFEDTKDVVSMKDAGMGVMLANLQGRVAVYQDKLTGVIRQGTFGPVSSYSVHDAAYSTQGGLAAYQSYGARFFDMNIVETSHYPTGGYAYDVVPNGNYLFVPSGPAGLVVLDNSDPTYPVTYSSLETGQYFYNVNVAAVSSDGNYCYVSDGYDKVWVVDISDKKNPFVVSADNPFTISSGNVTKLAMAGNDLVVGTSDSVVLVDVTTNPSTPVQLDVRYTGFVTGITTFTHSAFPDRLFVGVTSQDSFYTYRWFDNLLIDYGALSGIPNLSGVAVANDMAYLITGNADIWAVAIRAPFPFSMIIMSLLPIGYLNPPALIAKVDDTMLAVSGDERLYGYGWPAVFMVDIGTNPAFPALLPDAQKGVWPFDMLTGLSSSDGYVYYATDFYGTGAFSIKPDFDMPFITTAPTASPASPSGRLQGVVKLTAKVRDDSSAITNVEFKYRDASTGTWRRLVRLTNQTPAGVEGTYNYFWDTSSWQRATGPNPIRVEVTDSGCNTTIADSSALYDLNRPPTYQINWDSGCNRPQSSSGPCDPVPEWVVCGNLSFNVWGYDPWPNYPSDISQIAYKIDNGPWMLYDIPIDYSNPLSLSLDTTSLSEGPHTLHIRVTDAAGLQGFEDYQGTGAWTFTVHNNGPGPYIVSPPAGDVPRGSLVRVAAKMANEVGSLPVEQVYFYLDDPNPYDDIPDGAFIGKSLSADVNGEWAITWDASGVVYGDHILNAWAWDYGCCIDYGISPVVLIKVIFSAAVPPEIASGSSPEDAQMWSEDKITHSWPAAGAVSGYRVYHGTLAQLPALLNGTSDSCVRYDGSQTSINLSSDDPSTDPGRFFWYLVTAYNPAGEGIAGRASGNIERVVNSTGNCP